MMFYENKEVNLFNLIYFIGIISYTKSRCKNALFEKECKAKKNP